MRRALLVLASTASVALAIAATASSSPSTPVVDRGLPTSNLNGNPNPNRSNVAWSEGSDSITGDTFSVGSSGETWVITGIRTWNIGHLNTAFGSDFSDDTLYFGSGAIAPVESGTVASGSNVDSNPDITHTKVTYAGGSNYESSNNTDRQIWQNDFTNLHLIVNGGQTYYFAVDGASSTYLWFNHASNAALSGSPQQGADGTYYAWSKSDLLTPHACDSYGTFSGFCDGGWDKSSDINVQVFAYQVATASGSCKHDGWQHEARADGTSFRNQGACVSYSKHHDGRGADDQHAHDGNAGHDAQTVSTNGVPKGHGHQDGTAGSGKGHGKSH